MSDTYNHADEVLRSPQGHVLYIGDIQSAENIDWIHEKNIKTSSDYNI